MGRISEESVKKLGSFLDSLPPELQGKCALCNETLIHIVKQAEAQTGAGTSTVTHALADRINETALSGDRVNGESLRSKVIYNENPICRIPTNSDTLVCKFTGDEENYTPAEYVERSRIVMGSINTDPASNKLAQEVVMADIYYTKEDNGLDKSWEGNIFLNPPYSHGVIDKFVSKLIEELDETKQAILLTNNNTDTKWFHEAANNCALMCFTKGRINFYKTDGLKTSPVNGQTFFYFGPNTDLFKETFRPVGLIMEVK